MSRRSRNLKKAKKLADRQKAKAAKRARYAETQERKARAKAERRGKWRGIHRTPDRNRSRRSQRDGSSTLSLKLFDRLLGI